MKQPPRSLEGWYRLGKEARRRQSREHISLAALGKTYGIDHNLLRTAMGVADDYNLRTLRVLIRLRPVSATNLGLNHLRAFESLPDRRDRLALAEEVARGGLTVDEAEALVAERLGGHKRSSGGRKPKPARRPTDMLRQVLRETTTWLARYQAGWPEIAARVPPTEAKHLAAEIDKTRQALRRLARTASRFDRMLGKLGARPDPEVNGTGLSNPSLPK